MGSPVIEDLAGVPRTCTVIERDRKNTSLGHKDCDFLQLDTRAAELGMQSYGRFVFLFAERNFRLCVNRNFNTIFDPVLPEPNRIFGWLNLSNGLHENVIVDMKLPHSPIDVIFGGESCVASQNGFR